MAHDNGEIYSLYVPDGIEAGKTYPGVLALHGHPVSAQFPRQNHLGVPGTRRHQRIARAGITYASRHLADCPTLPELARVAAMTPSAFSRYFKRATGRNPSAFLHDLRIEQSARLLRETDRPITAIAGAVGFSTLTSFNRRFKERMHTTPRDYRRSFPPPGP